MAKSKKTSSSREVKERLLAVRIPQTLLDQLDDQLEKMKQGAPWVEMTRSDAVRWLLTLALRSLESGKGPTRP